MARKLKKGEAAVIVREHNGVKITSIGVTYGRKVNLGNYESANLECSMWVDFEGENDEKVTETLGWLWGLVRGDVDAQPELTGRQAPAPSRPAASLPSKQASATPGRAQEARKVADLPLHADARGVKPEPAAAKPDAGVAEAGPGRDLTKRIVSFGQPKMTAGIDADTFGELIGLTPDFERVCGKGSALTELAELCPGAFVVHQGERRYSRLALTQPEGEQLLKHFQTVIAGVKKGA